MRSWLLIATVIVGIIFMPTPAYAASNLSGLCPYAKGQYYRPVLPYFNSRVQQVALIDQYSYRVVQLLAENVHEVYFIPNGAWSPSCRYFAFDIVSGDDGGIVLWDTAEQKAVGTFRQKIYKGLNFLAWGDTDNYVILNAGAGQFLWKILSNEQIQISHDFDWWYYWDTPHGEVFWWDGRYFVAYDLNTGKTVRKFISPFRWDQSKPDLSPDGKTLTIRDKYLEKWSVTWDRSTGKIIDARAEPGRRPEDVQFSPDRRFLIIGGGWYGFSIYDVTVAEKSFTERCWPYTSIRFDSYMWRFADASTIELTSPKDGKKYLYDLNTKKVRSVSWSPIVIQNICGW
jgi:WD40 repeat protein